MRPKSRAFILQEVAQWRREGLIDDATMGLIEARYAGATAGTSWRPIVLTSIGALLVGLGVIALLAANWDVLLRPVRAAIAFAPLTLCALAWAAGRHNGWRKRSFLEPLAVFWVLAIGLCIAIISQTYQISGSADSFTLTWTLLMLPVLYATLSLGPAAAYFTGLFVWVCICAERGGNTQAYWLLAPLALPALRAMRADSPAGARVTVAVWSAALISTAALGFTLEKTLPGLWLVIYSGLFAALSAGGILLESGASGSLWQTPMRTLGGAGQAVLLYLLTFKWPWQEIGRAYWRSEGYYSKWQLVFDFTLAAALPLLGLGLSIAGRRRLLRESRSLERGLNITGVWLWGLAPVLMVALYGIRDVESIPPDVAALCVTGYLTLLALLTIARGLVSGALGVLNCGVMLVLAVIAGKFFNDEYSFTVRGLVFLACGIFFFIANWLAARRLRRPS